MSNSISMIASWLTKNGENIYIDYYNEDRYKKFVNDDLMSNCLHEAVLFDISCTCATELNLLVENSEFNDFLPPYWLEKIVAKFFGG